GGRSDREAVRVGVTSSTSRVYSPHPGSQRCCSPTLPLQGRVKQDRSAMPEIVCISPVDGREVVRRAASSAAEIEAAVAAARTAQAEWRRVPVAEGGRMLV